MKWNVFGFRDRSGNQLIVNHEMVTTVVRTGIPGYSGGGGNAVWITIPDNFSFQNMTESFTYLKESKVMTAISRQFL